LARWKRNGLDQAELRCGFWGHGGFPHQ
jgi:hypothetical protein